MDPYVGEIRMFAGNYAPVNWHLCDGSELQINQYEALYSLIGVTWGGNATTTFNLPDLRGRLPVGQGQGTGLSARIIAQTGGSSTVQLTEANLPMHTHAVNAANTAATTATVSEGVVFAQNVVPPSGKIVRYAPPGATPAQQNLDPDTISVAYGGNQSHANLMPYLAVNYIICTLGLYPERP